MKIRRIALIGAGAVGAYLIWSFEKTADITFTVVAEGTHAERLKRDGIIINGIHYPLHVQEPSQFGLTDARTEEQWKLEALSALFAESRLRWQLSDDIVTDIWLKYSSNIANNLPQAVIGAPAGLYFKSEHGLFLAQKLWAEVAAVAAAKGIQLAEDVLIFPGQSPSARYSTLQDLEADRHTEIDMFAGHMLRMAEETGISVPYCEYTFHVIKAMEEKNDGLFD